MINIIKSFKKDPIKNNFVGNWSSYLPLIDPFRDSRGGERIGNYMHWLKKELSKDILSYFVVFIKDYIIYNLF